MHIIIVVLYDSFLSIQQNNCVVKYDPQQTDLETGVNPPSYPCNYRDVYTYKLDHCNVTGLWSTYDPDIEWACEHLNLAYKWRYKNVFCYICNPSLVSTHSEIIYDRCNVTGNSIYTQLQHFTLDKTRNAVTRFFILNLYTEPQK